MAAKGPGQVRWGGDDQRIRHLHDIRGRHHQGGLTRLAKTSEVSPVSCTAPKSLADPVLRLTFWPLKRFFCSDTHFDVVIRQPCAWRVIVGPRDRGPAGMNRRLTIPLPPPPSAHASHSSKILLAILNRSMAGLISNKGDRDNPRMNSCLHLQKPTPRLETFDDRLRTRRQRERERERERMTRLCCDLS